MITFDGIAGSSIEFVKNGEVGVTEWVWEGMEEGFLSWVLCFLVCDCAVWEE